MSTQPDQKSTRNQITPGPWRINDTGKKEGLKSVVICCVESYQYDAIDIIAKAKHHNDDPRPNANLIAAAPDLLEASLHALNALLDYVDRLEKQGGSMNYGRGVIGGLEAAIAKAEGR